jgi:magnesium transporter
MTSTESERTPTFLEFREILESSPRDAAVFVEKVHPADIASWLQDVSDEDAWQVFSALEAEIQAEILEYAEEGLAEELVPRLSSGDLREIVEELPSDEAVDVLAEADERVAEDVLGSMSVEVATELRTLGAYPADSAGGVMTNEFVAVELGSRLGDAIKQIKKEGEDADEELGVFIIDAEGVPRGFLSDRDLLTHSIHAVVDDVMGDPFSIAVNEDQEEAANLIAKYNLLTLAVVDAAGQLVGVISAEDAADIAAEEASEDILKIVGAAGDPTAQTRLPVQTRVRQRMPLMAVTVGGGLLSAKILEVALRAGETAGEVTAPDSGAVLRYLPLIIGLAGNVGIQSSTILVRGFATGEVEPSREPSVLRAEVSVGCIVGFLCGAITAFVAAWMEGGNMEFGLALGAAVWTAVTWAALLGCVVPMTCRRLGIDPAIVAGPFLICLSDISGAVIFIFVAKLLLS